jgi:hypothetical protein
VASARVWAENCNHYLGARIGCDYCCGHWIALALTAIYRPHVVHSSVAVLDYLFTAFLIAWLSAAQWQPVTALVKLSSRD